MGGSVGGRETVGRSRGGQEIAGGSVGGWETVRGSSGGQETGSVYRLTGDCDRVCGSGR